MLMNSKLKQMCMLKSEKIVAKIDRKITFYLQFFFLRKKGLKLFKSVYGNLNF